MQRVSIRELTHNFATYLKEIKSGACITVLERNIPVADIIPHNDQVQYPGWKRPIKRRRTKGESFSTATVKSREME